MISNKPQVAQILENIRGLEPQEQLDLLEEIAALLRTSWHAYPKRSLLELEGLGADIWRGVPAQAYVNAERASWDG